jgi:hypothetical protein
MTYEEIWQKIKRMKHRDRKQLAYEMTLKGLNVGYVHPHYYFDAKGVHTILFYPKGSQHETDDKDGTYYNTLKEIVENDEEIHVQVKRFSWLPCIINDWREGKIVKDYICSRINEKYVNAYYKVLFDKRITGERSRSLFFTLPNGSEVVYKMTECSHKNGYELLTFSRTDY